MAKLSGLKISKLNYKTGLGPNYSKEVDEGDEVGNLDRYQVQITLNQSYDSIKYETHKSSESNIEEDALSHNYSKDERSNLKNSLNYNEK